MKGKTFSFNFFLFYGEERMNGDEKLAKFIYIKLIKIVGGSGGRTASIEWKGYIFL